MPPPRGLVAGSSSYSAQYASLDDDDDICPVCDGECTCRSKAGPSTSNKPVAPSAPSSSIATSSRSQKQRQTQSAAPYPLKIKLTVPPNLKFRKFGVTASSTDSRRPPTKAVPKLKAKYPIFVPAGSTSSHTSSPESSDYDSDDAFGSSDEDEDERFKPHGKVRSDPSQKRRDHTLNNRWELKPRKQSVGPEDVNIGAATDGTSDEDDGADDEDDGNEDDDEAEAEAEAEADVEGECFPDAEDEPIPGEADGKLGVSFGGVSTGWSEDEESSFDADIFFANLDDSSDSCSSPPALRNDAFASDLESDVNASFSADEEDALLLMNVDPSVHVRRTAGEFEVGVELDGLSFGWDGQLFLPPHLSDMNSLNLDLYNGSTESDIDMTASDSSTEDQQQHRSGVDAVILEETDGETTEDELVDSDGLPNPRAMMLFRWPTAVSAIDPASTMSPTCTSSSQAPANVSQTMRIALASMSAHRGSPPPTPADILAGKVSMDDLDDIEIHNSTPVERPPSSRGTSCYTSGAPIMGQFMHDPTSSQRHAVIDGVGGAVPTPFPSSRILRIKSRSLLSHMSADSHDLSTDAEPLGQLSSQCDVPLAVNIQPPSSEDVSCQSQVPTSEDPSSTEAIDLDDVLDASFMDSDPMFSEPEPAMQETWIQPRGLNRWDRIPVATFRRTRETPLMDGTASDTGLGNRYAGMSTFVNNDMLGTPKIRSGRPKGSSRRSKGKNNLLIISPVLLPVRDGEHTPQNGSPPSYNSFPRQNHSRHEKSRKELRKEKAMMKRKMIAKNVYSPQRHQQHHHRHHPNTKTRGTNSMQRTHSSASNSHVPRLNL